MSENGHNERYVGFAVARADPQHTIALDQPMGDVTTIDQRREEKGAGEECDEARFIEEPESIVVVGSPRLKHNTGLLT
jgi:hypothetical protein